MEDILQDLLTINKVEMVAHGHSEKEHDDDDEVIIKEIKEEVQSFLTRFAHYVIMK